MKFNFDQQGYMKQKKHFNNLNSQNATIILSYLCFLFNSNRNDNSFSFAWSDNVKCKDQT